MDNATQAEAKQTDRQQQEVRKNKDVAKIATNIIIFVLLVKLQLILDFACIFS